MFAVDVVSVVTAFLVVVAAYVVVDAFVAASVGVFVAAAFVVVGVFVVAGVAVPIIVAAPFVVFPPSLASRGIVVVVVVDRPLTCVPRHHTTSRRDDIPSQPQASSFPTTLGHKGFPKNSSESVSPRMTKSPLAMPTFLIVTETSSTWLYQAKKAFIRFLLMSTGTPSTVIRVFRVPMYLVWRRTDFIVKILPANCLASCSVANKISHSAFDLLARILGPILRIFTVSSIVSLLTPLNFQLYIGGQQ